MRNLKILQNAAIGLDADLPLSAQAWDTAGDALIVAFGPSNEKEVIELRRVSFSAEGTQETSELITSWDAPSPIPDLAVDKILHIHHFSYSDTTCLVLAGGDIIVVRGQLQPGQEKIEIVGSVDAGITAAAWSPDEELLAVATRAGTLLFMTVEFDTVANVTFNPEDVKLSKHVSVGWGKAETQFKGKRAKALRDPTMPETVDEGTLSANDNENVTISWRGDGAYVAVNCIEAQTRRMIRVYSREGMLDSVTEPVDGLEGALSWRPAGNLLASIQRLDDQINVIFFERNGLRHGQFALRIKPEDVDAWASSIELKWNIDSSTLAISFQDRVQLWTMGNYHYYLKQSIHLGKEGQASEATPTCWHPDQALRLTFLQSRLHGSLEMSLDVSSTQNRHKNLVHACRFVFAVNSGSTEAPNDLGTVAVVDGKILKVTPLKIANVPPPMALCDLELQTEIKDVAINTSNMDMAVLHENSVTLVHTHKDQGPHAALSDLKAERVIKLPFSQTQKAQQICFRGEEDIYVLLTDVFSGECSLYDIHKAVFHELPEEVSVNVSSIFPSVDHKMFCIATDTGVCELIETEGVFETRTLSVSPVITPWVEVVTKDEEEIAFGLTATGILYANERLLLRGCTSFLVTSAYLIVTTTNHLLKFIHLTDEKSLEVPPDEPELDERCRSIERGAKLVAVMPSAFSLTLQMPRGNLETIYPRALVLAGIRRNIEDKHYRKGFLACRSQRVDMNILHDHAPEQFLASIELIVKQLKTVEYIDLFLSQLRDEDVSQTLYKETLPRSSADEKITQLDASTSREGKVNRICDAFLEVLQSKYATNLQNVITAHVCKVPPNLEAGLGVAAQLREKQVELAETAIEHICFLADVNQLYDTALGMYDLDLALLVAQQSQKDPREYLPYLQSLQELPQLRKQFKIDDDLGRHVKALQHLHSLKSIEEVQTYTQKHELYKQALELCRYEPGNHASILGIYADFLNATNRYKEAAIAYESLSDHASATTAYTSALLWRSALSSALAVPLSPDSLQDLANTLASSLAESKDYAAAATIHLEHLSDLDTAARHLCKGYLFTDCARTLRLHARPDLLPTILDPSLIDASATLTELLADCKAQLGAQLPRLRDLRKLKSADPLAFFDGGAAGGGGGRDNPDIPDDISLAPSSTSTAGGASLFTRYTARTGTNASGTLASNTTRRSSKNRRREERKRARGKKGSVYEEEYLINSIGRLVIRVNDTAGDVERTVEGLLARGMWERARAVEGAMVEVVQACEACIGEVWGTGGTAAGSSGAVSAAAPGNAEINPLPLPLPGAAEDLGERPQGADGVVWDSLMEERRGRVAPVVRGFERCGLLG